MANAGNFKVPDQLPEWFKMLRNESELSSRDVVNLFGFASADSLHDKHFPSPDRVSYGSSGVRRRVWKVSTLKREIARRREANCQ